MSVRLLPLAIVTALLASAASAGAATWRDIGTITPDTEAEVHHAVDSRGKATFFFRQLGSVMYRDRRARGRFGPAKEFPYRPPKEFPYRGTLPELAVGAADEQFAAWAAGKDGAVRVFVSARPRGRGWGAPQALSAELPDVRDIKIATAPGGEVVITWLTVHGFREVPAARTVYDATINAVVRPAGAAAFGPPAGLGRGDITPGGTALGLDRRGNGLVAWSEWGKGVLVARHPAGQGFAGPQTLVLPGRVSPHGPRLAVAPSGRAVIAWIDAPGYRGPAIAALGTTRTGFGEPAELAADSNPPEVAIDDRLAAVGWTQGAITANTLRARAVLVRRGDDLEDQPKRVVARVETYPMPHYLLTVARGRVTFAWNHFAKVHARSATANGDFRRKQLLSSRHVGAQVLLLGANRRGNVFAVWETHYSYPPTSTIDAAKASRRTGRFAEEQPVAPSGEHDGIFLEQGAGGSMLLGHRDVDWNLRAYGER